jgi:hypothetical protein
MDSAPALLPDQYLGCEIQYLIHAENVGQSYILKCAIFYNLSEFKEIILNGGIPCTILRTGARNNRG